MRKGEADMRVYYADDLYFAAYALSHGAELADLREESRNGRQWFIFGLEGEVQRILLMWNSPDSPVNSRKFVSNEQFLRGRIKGAMRRGDYFRE